MSDKKKTISKNKGDKMKYKDILLGLLLIFLVCLSIQSIYAENIDDDLNEIETIDLCSNDLNINANPQNPNTDSYSNDLNINANPQNPNTDSYSNDLNINANSDNLKESNSDNLKESNSDNPIMEDYEKSYKLSDSNQDIISAQDSDPLPNVEEGTVSGGVNFVNTHPWAPSDATNGNKGNITYNIPINAEIKSAYVYVNVYSGSGGTAYGAYANTTLITANGETQLGSEYLWTSTSTTDGVSYIVNDHITRCYSDYMIFYNVTDMLQGLNGSPISIGVHSYPMEGYSFDGRIKLISLFIAWDDGDSDEIYYWLNAGQAWTDDTENGLYHNFENLPSLDYSNKLSTLINVGISSADAVYFIDGIPLFSESDEDEYLSGAYYQYHKWDVSQYMGSDTIEFRYKAVGGAYGPSFKDIISILTIQDIPTYEENQAQISLSPEYIEIPCTYAGTNNTLSIKVTTIAGKYTIKLLADGYVVNQTEIDLNDGANTLLLTDSTIRPVDEFAVNGCENRKVNYTVEVYSNGNLINSSSLILPLLYNGNLGKDLAYPSGGIDHFLNITVNGDIVIDVQDYSHYISHNVLNRSEIWNVDLDADSSIVKSFIYIPYYEFNSKTYDEDFNMFNVTFNSANIIPIALYRDQSNLGNDYYSGYGVLLYDVTDLIRNGENILELKKKFDTPAVYPSALIYMYNTTGSRTIKEIYIYNGADLLENVNNLANRTVHSDSVINVNSKLTSNSTLYVFAGGPQADEGNLIFNGKLYENIWNATMASNEAYTLDVTDDLRDSNSISFVSTGFRIIALQQIMVLAKNIDMLDIALESEYPNVCFAGTNNLIFANIDSNGERTVIARLLADGAIVNETEINLAYGHNEFSFVDSTIRPVDEFAVNGAQNKIVNYTLQLLSGNEIIANNSIDLSLLYNGYLSKDLAYEYENGGFIPGGIEPFLNITITGDIVISVKDASTFLSDFGISRSDKWNIDLSNKSDIVKAFVYVPYEFANINLIAENGLFNAKFNNNQISPVAWYRDQSNLGQYGKYGYGLFVYDVTELAKNGENIFALSKNQPTPRVYPSTLVYMYNTSGSDMTKNIYISNGADLLENMNNAAGREVQANSKINIGPIEDDAKLYIFAANAQDGGGDILFNEKLYENVWKGSSSSTGLFTLDISNSIKNNNDISFIVRSGSILALQQIIVTTQRAKAIEKVPTAITAPSVTTVYNVNKNLVITLKDSKGNAVSNAKLTVVLNGASKVLTTNSKGQCSFAIPSNLVPKTYTATISYGGDRTHLKSSFSTKVTVKKASVKLTAKAKTFKSKAKVKKYTVTLKNNKSKAMKKVKLTLKLKGKTYKATTNTKGNALFKIKNLSKKGKYTAKVIYSGNKYFNSLTKKVKITIK